MGGQLGSHIKSSPFQPCIFGLCFYFTRDKPFQTYKNNLQFFCFWQLKLGE